MTFQSTVIEIGTLTYQIISSLGALIGSGIFAYLLQQILNDFLNLPNLKRIRHHNTTAIENNLRQWSDFKRRRAGFIRWLTVSLIVSVLGVLCILGLIVFPPVEQQNVKILNVKQSMAAIGIFALAVLGWCLKAWRINAKKALDEAKSWFPN